MSYFLAVDAGGTKTDYVLADETRVLARVRGGTIKRLRTDAAVAGENLDSALAELALRCGVSMTAVVRTCIGTAGESVPLVANWLRAAFLARVGGELILVGDVEIALDAAFPGAPGVLVLAGTGSNVAGRARDGRLTTAGGWGPALADQGSGHWIGLQALRALFLARDERKETTLMAAVLARWGLGSVEELVEYANLRPGPDFSELTLTVLDCAERGDETAAAVLREEGEKLAHLVCLVMRRLQAAAAEERGWTPPVAFAGSIMEKVPPVREALTAAMLAEFPDALIREGVVDPIDGALWRARRGVSQR